jgi:hypothetical protein
VSAVTTEVPARGRALPLRIPPPLPDVLGVAVVAGALLFLWLRFGKLFPEVEFIDWTWVPHGDLSGTWDTFWREMNPFEANGFSRQTSSLYMGLIGDTCGDGRSCLNALAFLPVVVSSALLYASARVMRLPASAAAAVCVVWLISQPLFDAMTWQGTSYDRLATALSLLVLLSTYLAIRWIDRWPWVAIAGASLVLTALSIMTVNTKEPAWAILPLLLLAPVLVARGRRQMIRAAVLVALPFVLCAIHVVLDYVAAQDDPVTKEHVGTGSIRENLPKLTDLAVPSGMLYAGIVVGVCLVGLALVAVWGRGKPRAVQTALLAVWVGVAALAGWIIPSKTTIPSPFYMVLPLATAALAAALGLRAGYLAVEDRKLPFRLAWVVVGFGLAGWAVVASATDRLQPYDDWMKLDANWRKTIPQLVEIRNRYPTRHVQFSVPPEQFRAYRFGSSAIASNFWRLTGAAKPIDLTYQLKMMGGPPCPPTKDVVIKLSAAMEYQGVCP